MQETWTRTQNTAALDTPFDQVLAAARLGEDWAWNRIYKMLAPAVLRYLRSRGAVDADNICGEVFCHLFQQIHRFEGDAAGFRSWVFVMTHHRLVDDFRRQRGRTENTTTLDSLDVLGPANVEREVLQRLEADEVRNLIARLPTPQREVVMMHAVLGLGLKDISEAIGRSVAAVKALEQRGLAKLRRELTDKPAAA